MEIFELPDDKNWSDYKCQCCKKLAEFNYRSTPAREPKYCGEHKVDGMVNVKKKRRVAKVIKPKAEGTTSDEEVVLLKEFAPEVDRPIEAPIEE